MRAHGGVRLPAHGVGRRAGLEQAWALDAAAVAAELGGLPPASNHAAALAVEALRKARRAL